MRFKALLAVAAILAPIPAAAATYVDFNSSGPIPVSFQATLSSQVFGQVLFNDGQYTCNAGGGFRCTSILVWPALENIQISFRNDFTGSGLGYLYAFPGMTTSGSYATPSWFPNVATVTLSQVEGSGILPSAVPEPSTWALMIVGVGVAGIALRRRRRLNSKLILKPA